MKAKTAIVTGASRGIGKAIATKLASEGYNLILNCKTNIALLEKLASDLSEEYGIVCHTVDGDIGLHSTAVLIKKAAQSFNSVDILVHNAAISKVGLITDMTPDEWDEILNTNLSSCFFLTKEIAPLMISAKNGKFLFISSVWGEHGASCEVAYSATKGGVNSFTKALAKELAPSRIAVNALACGMIDTDMNKAFSDEEKAVIIEEIPAGKIASPKEVAEMASLILKAPDYLTGQIITFDGGWQ